MLPKKKLIFLYFQVALLWLSVLLQQEKSPQLESLRFYNKPQDYVEVNDEMIWARYSQYFLYLQTLCIFFIKHLVVLKFHKSKIKSILSVIAETSNIIHQNYTLINRHIFVSHHYLHGSDMQKFSYYGILAML